MLELEAARARAGTGSGDGVAGLEEERALHALALVEVAVELRRAGLGEHDLHVHVLTRLERLVDVERGTRERVGVLALVLQVEGERLAGRALDEGGAEVEVVELDLDLVAGRRLGALVVGRARQGHRLVGVASR